MNPIAVQTAGRAAGMAVVPGIAAAAGIAAVAYLAAKMIDKYDYVSFEVNFPNGIDFKIEGNCSGK